MASSSNFSLPDIGGGNKIVAGDFNGDGKSDLFVINYDWPTGTKPSSWALLLGNGSSYSVAQNVTTTDYSFPGKILVADLNGDGCDDIFVGTYGDENRQSGAPDMLLLGSRTGLLTESRALTAIKTWAHGSSLGDIDNDGDTDILNTGIGALPSSVWLNDGHAGYTLSNTSLPTNTFPYFQTANIWSTLIADFNADGRNDIVVGHSGGEYALLPYGYSRVGAPAAVFSANADGSYTSILLPSGIFGLINTDTVSIAAADFDGDGRTDLLLSNYDKGAFLENGQIVYTGDANTGAGAGTFVAGGETLTRAGMDNREIQLLLNKPSGWVDASSQILSGTSPTLKYLSTVRAIDLDGDGDLDIAGTVADQLTKASTGPFLWLNDGAGRFTAVNTTGFASGLAASVYEWSYVDVSGNGDWRMVAVFATDQSYPLKAVHLSDSLVPRVGIGGSADTDLLRSDTVVSQAVFAHGGDDRLQFAGLTSRAELGAGNDRISAGDGNATIVGGAGDDRIDGGAGVDTAVYLGAQAGYAVTKNADGYVVLDHSGIEGRDLLVNVELLRFADRSVDLRMQAPAADLALAAASYAAGKQQVSGTAPANATVQVFGGEQLLGQVQADAGGAWRIDVPLSAARGGVAAQALDAQGNASFRATLFTYHETAAAPLVLGEGHHLVQGSAGLDKVSLAGAGSAWAVATTAGGVSLTRAGSGETVLLSGVERVAFEGSVLAFDVDGHAGQALRIYQAAFNRAPDGAGLGYWVGAMDAGVSLAAVAGGFVASNEFIARYGVSPNNRQLVEQFYQNVLHRAGEAAGIDFWTGLLDGGRVSVVDVLVGFSESAENKAALVGLVEHGIAYTPFG